MDKRNQEHYFDLTAAEAVENVFQREREITELVTEIKRLLSVHDCKLAKRVIILDERTKKVYK